MTANVFYKHGEIAISTDTWLLILLKGLFLSKLKFEEHSTSFSQKLLIDHKTAIIYENFSKNGNLKIILPSSLLDDAHSAELPHLRIFLQSVMK